MKNTQYVRQVRQAHCKQAQFKKGIAPIIIALIVAVILGGGYVAVKTNPGIAKKLGIERQAEKDIKKDEKVGELSFDFSSESKKCEKYVRIANSDGQFAQFQTSAPRDNKSSVESGYDIGLRNKFGTKSDMYEYTVSIEQPDSTIATARGQVTGSNWSTINFPKSFVGSKVLEGVYTVSFKIQNKVVTCDEFKVVASDWKTYTNEKYGFEMKYPAEWKTYIPQVKDVIVVLGLKAGKGNGDIDGDVFVDAYKKTEIYLDKKEDGSLKSPMETLVERTGPSDRKVMKETRTINGVQATKVTVTDPSLSGWKSEKFFIERGNTIFVLSNGAVPKQMFEPVVLSFKFTK